MGLSDLFGGSDKIDILTGSQKKLLGSLSNIVQQNLGKPGEVYGGQTVAGINPAMQGVYNSASGVTQIDPNLTSAMATQLGGAGDPTAVRSMYNEALLPAQLDFQRTLRDVGARYGDTWGRTGALPEMLGRSTAEYGMGLNQLLGQLTYNDQQAALNRQGQALNPALALEQQQNQNLGIQYGLGQDQRTIEQEGLTSDYQKWLSGQWYNNPALGFIQPVLGTQANAIGQQTGLIPGIMNTANSAVQLGQGLMGLF